jgi:hypothetical protein
MKLLCIFTSYWPAFQFGGPIFSVRELNKRLAGKGIDVTVYTTNAGLETCVGATGGIDIDNVRVNYFVYAKLFHFFGSTGWHFYKMPLFIRSFLYFLYRYIIKLGFLDGKQCLVFHFWHGFWCRLVVDIEIFNTRRYRMRRCSAHCGRRKKCIS